MGSVESSGVRCGGVGSGGVGWGRVELGQSSSAQRGSYGPASPSNSRLSGKRRCRSTAPSRTGLARPDVRKGARNRGRLQWPRHSSSGGAARRQPGFLRVRARRRARAPPPPPPPLCVRRTRRDGVSSWHSHLEVKSSQVKSSHLAMACLHGHSHLEVKSSQVKSSHLAMACLHGHSHLEVKSSQVKSSQVKSPRDGVSSWALPS